MVVDSLHQSFAGCARLEKVSCLADFLPAGIVSSQMAELMHRTKGWITVRLVYSYVSSF